MTEGDKKIKDGAMQIAIATMRVGPITIFEVRTVITSAGITRETSGKRVGTPTGVTLSGRATGSRVECA